MRGLAPRTYTSSSQVNPLAQFRVDAESVAWRDREAEALFIAQGVAREFASADAARDYLRGLEIRDLPFAPRCFGYLAFDQAGIMREEWSGFSLRRFFLPQVLTRVVPSGQATSIEFLREERPRSSAANTDLAPAPAQSFTRQNWIVAVNRLLGQIAQSRVSKCVLSERVTCAAVADADLGAVLTRLSAANPECTFFALSSAQGTCFTGASPERLFLLDGNRLEVESLAGTRARAAQLHEDRALMDELKSSEKEQREQNFVTNYLLRTLVKFIRSEPVSTHSIRRLANVQHLLTQLTAQVRETISLDELTGTLHPTPAVGGTPTAAALDFIRAHEPHSRGLYAGAVGWVEADRAEFVVAIRSGLLLKDRSYLYGGAGIVAGSAAHAEYDECLLKMETLRRALA